MPPIAVTDLPIADAEIAAVEIQTPIRPVSEQMASRFGVTLVANLLRLALSFATGILIARTLGAADYGDLSFLLGSFTAVGLLLEAGTSSAFFTFISRRRQNARFFVLYFSWISFQLLLTTVAIALVFPETLIDHIWFGHARGTILLALVATFLTTQVWTMLNQLAEATRKTVITQSASVAQALVHLALVALCAYSVWLSIQTVMWLLVAEYVVLVGLLVPKLTRENLGRDRDGEGFKAMVAEFARYCKPLLVYGWIGFIYAFADRWLLQRFGGSRQQGLFAVGDQFATVCLTVTSSIINVFWKEVAEAREFANTERLQMLFVLVPRVIFLGTSFVACFLVPFSRDLLSATVGHEYEAAWFSLALLFFFRVQQAEGQTQGTFFYATGEVTTYTKISITMMLISLPVTYLMLAPSSAAVPGLELGAAGVSLKLVVLAVIATHIQGYAIAKANGWKFDGWRQFRLLGFLIPAAFGANVVGIFLARSVGAVQLPFKMAFAGGIYTVLIAALIWRWPRVAGLSRSDLARVNAAVKNVSQVVIRQLNFSLER